jgi:hypothetical protein
MEMEMEEEGCLRGLVLLLVLLDGRERCMRTGVDLWRGCNWRWFGVGVGSVRVDSKPS